MLQWRAHSFVYKLVARGGIIYVRARAVVNRFVMVGTAYECPKIRLLRRTLEAGDKGVSSFAPSPALAPAPKGLCLVTSI